MVDDRSLFKELKRKFITSVGLVKPYKSIFWNAWEDCDDSIGVDYCYGLINENRTECFIDTVEKVGPRSDLLFVSAVEESSKGDPDFYILPKSVKDFMWFQKEGFLKSGLTTKIFIFDDSLSWIMHIDESVLFTGEDCVIDLIVSRLGGKEKVIESMQLEMSTCSGYAKDWRQSILNRFAGDK